MGEGRRRGVLVVALAVVLMLTGCAGVNVNDASERLTAAAESSAYAAVVEVQHPGAPWVDKIVIRLYVRDGTAEGVAAAVRDVAVASVDDPDLSSRDLTFIAYEGRPEENSNIDDLFVMGSVSEIVGGKGVEGVLVLKPADVQRLADEQ